MALLTSRDPLAEAPNDADIIHIVDVSDITDNAGGTSKKLTIGNLFARLFSVLKFDISATTDAAPGEVRWDNDVENFVFGVDSASVPLGSPFYIVRNSTGTTLTKGTPVYANGTIGASSRITVDKMIADGSIPGRFYLGILLEDVLDGADGIAIDRGKIRGIDTSAFADGEELFIDPTTAGTFTNVEPTAPNLKLPVAFVIHSSATVGSIETRATSGHSFSDNSDVHITAIAPGEIPKWDGTRWINNTLSEAGISAESHTHTASEVTDFDTEVSNNADVVASERTANKDAANGYAGLDALSKINPAHLPALAISETFVVATEVAQLALTVQEGDVAVRTDESKSYIALNATNATMADWQELLTPADVVQSIYGRTGAVTAQSGDYNTGQVTEVADKRYMTDAQEAKLDSVETNADVTDAENVGSVNAGATSKATPLDADSFPIVDSAAANVIKRLTFTNLKAYLKTYFDSVTTTLTNKTITSYTAYNTPVTLTGVAETFALAHTSVPVQMENAAANTITVPPNSSVAFPVGARLFLTQIGAGATTIAAGAGVTINAPTTVTLAIGEQYESRGLLKTATDTWELI